MRKKLAIRNLVISQTIIIMFLMFAYFQWFPYSFSSLGGFTNTAFMLILVDLVLGPLLVFIIYREGKKYLTFDINVLLAIQLSAFAFGAYALYLKHPAYAVFNGDKFVITNASHIYPPLKWEQQIKNAFLSTPKLVITTLPQSEEKTLDLLLNINFMGAPKLERRPKYFLPFKDNIDSVLDKSIPYQELIKNKAVNSQISQLISKFGGKYTDYAYFKLVGNNKKPMIWVFDRNTAKPVGIIDNNPWAMTNKQAQIQSRLP